MKLLKKLNREIIAYLICGVITTLVNYVVFFVARKYFAMPLVLANVVAFIVAVIEAYVTNKYFVYQQYSLHPKVVLKEFTSFVSLRIVSMLIETGLLYVLVEYLHLSEYIVKIGVSFLIVILNYVFGKFITFRRENTDA